MSDDVMSHAATRALTVRLVVQTSVWLCFQALLLFGAAGTWSWPQGWAFLAIFWLGGLGFCVWLLPRDPALLAARLGPVIQPGQPLWDQIFLVTFVGLWCGWLVLMALDAQRWHASDMSLALNVAGAAFVVGGFLATLTVFRANSFAAPVVRVQTERAQRVIDTGPYAVVRHPMYASAILYLVGMPLLLGSWWGLLAVPLLVLGIAPRAVLEERLLQRDLPGYAAYMTRVRYRLVPGVW